MSICLKGIFQVRDPSESMYRKIYLKNMLLRLLESREFYLHLKTAKTGSDVPRGRAVHFNHRKTMDRNNSSDAEETLNVYLQSYDGPQIQL